MDVTARLALIALVACSGKTSAPKSVVDDALANARGDAAATGDAEAVADPSGKGDVVVRVEWKDVPADARGAPGRTACGTARPAQVAPTVLWGIPEVFVQIDAPGAGAGKPHRIVLADCILQPRIAVATGSVTIASAMPEPAQVSIQRTGELPLGGAGKEADAREIYLPVAGHEVEVALETGSIYRIAAGDETSWVVATDSPYVGITEASGNVLFRDVPAGTHAVTAWLPPRSGQPARVGHGKLTVAAGEDTEVKVDLTTQ